MHETQHHQLLAQVPLSVSPFVNLPAAPTLPYTYKAVPSTLAPSLLDRAAAQSASTGPKAPFVQSSSGHSAHPYDILNSCTALKAHLDRARDDGAAKVQEWEQDLKDKDLAERRRVAPGWLDRDEKILEPIKPSGSAPSSSSMPEAGAKGTSTAAERPPQYVSSEESEIDRVFGRMEMK